MFGSAFADVIVIVSGLFVSGRQTMVESSATADLIGGLGLIMSPLLRPAVSISMTDLPNAPGGLSPAGKTSPSASGVELTELAPLPETNETASGVWARKVVFENPMP
jgi:hypothetical protein